MVERGDLVPKRCPSGKETATTGTYTGGASENVPHPRRWHNQGPHPSAQWEAVQAPVAWLSIPAGVAEAEGSNSWERQRMLCPESWVKAGRGGHYGCLLRQPTGSSPALCAGRTCGPTTSRAPARSPLAAAPHPFPARVLMLGEGGTHT